MDKQKQQIDKEWIWTWGRFVEHLHQTWEDEYSATKFKTVLFCINTSDLIRTAKCDPIYNSDCFELSHN